MAELNTTIDNVTDQSIWGNCTDQKFIPAWNIPNMTRCDRALRVAIYFIIIVYFFVGVNVVVDKFMAAIYLITSQKRAVHVKNDKGETQIVYARIWNDTVANLSLISMGCSAPEILLTYVELIGNDYMADDLGPGTVVGSAIINLLFIVGVCMLLIPTNEVRRIKRFTVFVVIYLWSIFAYVYMYIILVVSSPGIVEIWEAAVQLILFPVSLLTFYLADRHVVIHNYLAKTYRMGKNGVIVEMTADSNPGESDYQFKRFEEELESIEVQEFEEQRRAFIVLIKNLRHKYPNMGSKELELMAEKELLDRGTKSRVYYRMMVSKKLAGISIARKESRRTSLDLTGLFQEHQRKSLSTELKHGKENITKIFFSPGHYTVMENIGHVDVTIVREGGDLNKRIQVDYCTEDGVAVRFKDYSPAKDTITFEPGQKIITIQIQIIDDSIYKGDQHFYIRLLNPRSVDGQYRSINKGDITDDAYKKTVVVSTAASIFNSKPIPTIIVSEHDDERKIINDRFDGISDYKEQEESSLCLVCPSLATVMILDDDHQGIFSLTERTICITETVGVYNMKIIRCGGSKGRISLPYKTEEGTGIPKRDYRHCQGEVVFEDGDTEYTFCNLKCRIMNGTKPNPFSIYFIRKTVPVYILTEVSYIKNVTFYFTLEKPKQIQNNNVGGYTNQIEMLNTINELCAGQCSHTAGLAQLGEITKATIRLKENKEFKNTIDKLIKKTNMRMKQTTCSWVQQFFDCFHPEIDQDDDLPERKPNKKEYAMHLITFFWRLLLVVIPPPDLLVGYPCFVSCVVAIGVFCTFIGDFAQLFGCYAGIQDVVIAITFISVGTTVPDFFSAKLVAVRNPHCDASINSVTGSNSLKVFLGIGGAWTLAAVYHSLHGNAFIVKPGSMTFALTLYCVMAVAAFVILLLRRLPAVGGELGGPLKYRIPSAFAFLGMWLVYMVISSLESYNIVKGF